MHYTLQESEQKRKSITDKIFFWRMTELDQQVRHLGISIRNIDNIFLLKYNLHKNIVKICLLADPEHIDYIVKFIIYFLIQIKSYFQLASILSIVWLNVFLFYWFIISECFSFLYLIKKKSVYKRYKKYKRNKSI